MPKFEIHPSHFPELNKSFYAEHPTSYLKTRLTLLIALCDPTRPIEKHLADGVDFGGLKIQTPTGTPEEIEGFAALESMAILHLASETLLRQYFAHESFGYCPAIELANLTSFRVFKEKVRALQESEAPADWLSVARRVFRGSDARSDFPSVDRKTWKGDGDHLKSMLKTAADTLLAESNGYNAYKHGLALQLSHPYLSLGNKNKGDGQFFEFTGPAISYLHRTREEGGQSEWSRSTAFISIEAALALTALVVEELDCLWTVARRNYLSKPGAVNFQAANRLSSIYEKHAKHGVLRLALTHNFGPPVQLE